MYYEQFNKTGKLKKHYSIIETNCQKNDFSLLCFLCTYIHIYMYIYIYMYYIYILYIYYIYIYIFPEYAKP